MLDKNLNHNFLGGMGILYAAIFGLFMVGAFVGCTVSELTSSSGSSGDTTATGNTGDLSGIGLTPDASWHDHYRLAAHDGHSCSNCHTKATARTSADVSGTDDISSNVEFAGDQICNQCHNGNYANSVFNHGAHNIGTYCNSCHYSDSWRNSRVATNLWHYAVTSSCETCHKGLTPATHDNGRTSGCENCHSYPSWAATTGGSHTYTSGCGSSSCHGGLEHGQGNSCENCHSYNDWKNVSGGHNYSSGCSDCHGDREHGQGSTCEDCHSYNDWGNVSGGHTYTSGCSGCHGSLEHGQGATCENCHSYNNWGNVSGGHSYTSGCDGCHSKHKSSCENCHVYPNWGNVSGDDDD